VLEGRIHVSRKANAKFVRHEGRIAEVHIVISRRLEEGLKEREAYPYALILKPGGVLIQDAELQKERMRDARQSQK
jgi:hypothetical protein